MLQGKNTRTNQIAFLTHYITLWDFYQQDFFQQNNTVEKGLVEILLNFCLIAGLPNVSADDLLAELKKQNTNLEKSTSKFFISDNTGRGNVTNTTDLRLLSMLDERNYDGEHITEWGAEAEEGDTFKNATITVTCIHG